MEEILDYDVEQSSQLAKDGGMKPKFQGVIFDCVTGSEVWRGPRRARQRDAERLTKEKLQQLEDDRRFGTSN